MSLETFDIINGPSGLSEPKEEFWADGPRFSKGFIVGCVVAAIGFAGSVWLAVIQPQYLPLAILAFMAVALVGAMIGKFVNSRSESKRSWLESEIELSWFRSLNQTQSDFDNLDWDLWQRNSEESDSQERISDYERGFRNGYARGILDAG